MASWRTKARYRWLMSAVQLLFYGFFRYKAKQYVDVDREDLTPEDSPTTALWAGASQSGLTASLSPTHLSIGFVKSVLYEIVYDYDLWGIRQSRRTQLVVAVAQIAVQRRIVGQSPGSRFNYDLGRCLGQLLYRTRYGLLGEPRGDGTTADQ
ncbi:hypothetical protein [Halohasta litorea]|uniref:DUF8097 domain-containing protein n=1 Tax=Halohasta litorea TaxID=869891 RepID=A0ABD6DAB9_9EURY|nr:hypothetical protein [Halohasta litorea]